MKGLRGFNIDIYQLSNNEHAYQYDIEDSFFENFEDSFIEKGNLHVDLVLEKGTTLLTAVFNIKGTVELICDRSLEPFDFDIDTEQKIIFKYGEEHKELSDEIIMIPFDEHRINVGQLIYEFIGLEIPMKKLHPKFAAEEENEDEESEGKIIYTSREEDDDDDEESTDQDSTPDDDVDPRWKDLLNLRNLN